MKYCAKCSEEMEIYNIEREEDVSIYQYECPDCSHTIDEVEF